MNPTDSLEEELRALAQPVSPELKARIARDLGVTQNISAQNAQHASLLAAGVMLALAVGLFAMVRRSEPARVTTAEPNRTEKTAKRVPAEDDGETAKPKPPDGEDDGKGNAKPVAKAGDDERENKRNLEHIEKLKGVLVKQQQKLIIEQENAEHAREDKEKAEAKLKDLAASISAEQEAARARIRERELFNARVSKLLEQVKELYDRGAHSAAGKLAVQVLKIDPGNEAAEAWKLKAQGNPIAAHVEETTEEEKWKASLLKKLQKKVTFDLVNATFDEAINLLRTQSEVTIIVDPAVMADKQLARINMKIDDMSIDLALKKLLDSAGLEKILKDHAVYISMPVADQAAAHLEAGKRLFKDFQYEDARKEFAIAAARDSANDENLRWLIRVNDMLAMRENPATVPAKKRASRVVNALASDHDLTQMKLDQFDKRMDIGKRYMSEAQTDPDLSPSDRVRKYALAQSTFDVAGELLKDVPVEVNVEERKSELSRLLAESRKALAEAQRGLTNTNHAEDNYREGDEIASQLTAHLQAGKRQVDAFQYEDARKEFEIAVGLDRNNAESRDWLTKVNDILAARRDRIKAAVAQFTGERKVTTQEKLIELDNRIDWGKRYMSQPQNDPELPLSERIRKYQQAQLTFERALELIKYMPIEVNVDEQKSEVERLLKETQKAAATAQESGTQGEQSAPAKALNTDVREKLQTKVSFDFVDKQLADAVNEWSRLSNIKIVIDPKLLAKDVGKTPITLRVKEMEAESALKWILKLADLDCDLRKIGGVETVFVCEKAGLAAPVELRIYDVADLTGEPAAGSGPDIQLVGANRATAALAEEIRKHVNPDQWDSKLGTSIEEMAGRLVVMQRPEVHEAIDQFLVGVRKEKKENEIESRVYDVRDLIEEESLNKDKAAELIREKTGAGSWKEGTSIKEENGKLIVKQRAEVHKKIEEYLAGLRHGKVDESKIRR